MLIPSQTPQGELTIETAKLNTVIRFLNSDAEFVITEVNIGSDNRIICSSVINRGEVLLSPIDGKFTGYNAAIIIGDTS